MSQPKTWEEYEELTPAATIERCPVCGCKAGLWRFAPGPNASRELMVECSNGAAFGPQASAGLMNEGCLLYTAPAAFRQATQREALAYWNAYAISLRAVRITNLRETQA